MKPRLLTGSAPTVVVLLLAWGCSPPDAPEPRLEVRSARPPGRPFGTVADRAVSVVAGTGEAASTGDGGPALAASLEQPGSLAIDNQGNLYIAERLRIRKVAPDGTITTFAGNGTRGKRSERASSVARGDGGPARGAQVDIPEHLTFAPDGSLYFVEPLAGRIRRVAPDGTIDTVVGGGPRSCGLAPSSYEGKDPEDISLCFPLALGILPDADIVFEDNEQLWRVHQDRVTLFAGDGQTVLDPSAIGDGGPATEASLTLVSDVVVDGSGTVYIAEDLDGRVRKVSPAGEISTFADDLGGASDLLFDERTHLLVASSTGGLIRVRADGSATQLLPGFLGSLASPNRIDNILFGPTSSDMALDTQGNLYVSVNIEGFQNVLRIQGPFW